MTAYTRVFDVDPGSPNRSRSVEAEFDLVAAGFATVEAAVALKLGVVPILGRTITGAATLGASDNAKLIDLNGAFTLGLTAAATLGDGWWSIWRIGASVVTVSAVMDGVTGGSLYPGFLYLARGDGATFTLSKLSGSRREVWTTGTAWVCPIGVRDATAGAQGGGGSGAKQPSTGAAGAGGGYASIKFKPVPGTSYAYAIGAAGTVIAANTTNGNAGSATTFNTGAVTITGSGGPGGVSYSAIITTQGGAATNGDLNIAGGHGILHGNALTVGGASVLGRGGQADSTVNLAATGYGGGGSGTTNGATGTSATGGCLVMEF